MTNAIKGAGIGILVLAVYLAIYSIKFASPPSEEVMRQAGLTENPDQAGKQAEIAPISGSLADHIVAACKGTLALMNGRDVTTFSGRKIDDRTAHVSWRSPDDGKLWQARCEMIGTNRLRWAAYNAFGDGKQGRWRDEDAIEVRVDGDLLRINLKESGLSERRSNYALSELE